ncbi:MAG: L,D-transpeptidase family protein [Beijerinckiaceae bacterium]
MRATTPSFLAMTAASLALALPLYAGEVEERIIVTPGLPPLTVLVGEREDVEAKALERRAAEKSLTESLNDKARQAAQASIALADPGLPAPDYPAIAPQILERPLLPAPDYPTQAPPMMATVPASPADVIREAAPPLADIASALKPMLEKPGSDHFHPRLSRLVREDVAALYAARNHLPFWIESVGLSGKGRALQAQLQRAGDDGLDEASYRLPRIGEDAHAYAAFDIAMTQAVVLYARDAQGARIEARRLSTLIDPEITLSSPADIVAQLMQSEDSGARLQRFNPQHAGYRALRDHLVRMRVAAAPAAPLPSTPIADATPPSLARTKRRTAAVALAASPGEADLIANMERWRWLPRELGERHVFVNIPEYRVRVVDSGAVVHEARAIVGKPDSQTPLFSDRMQFLVVNPSWFVPPSIMKKEFLPKLAEDPTYAERRGYQVIRRGNQIYVKQPPGERNALGHIKFMFPNRHAVYLHDTPSRNLFGAERRAFSHGCVRVDQPFRLAEMVLGKENGWSEQRVRGLVGRGEQAIKLAQPLPVHLAYFTSFVDDLGRLQTRDDLYGHHRRVKAALGLE